MNTEHDDTKLSDLTIAELQVIIRETVSEMLHLPLTIDDLNWTQAQAAFVRGQFAAFAEDWDNPEMDVYDVG